MNAVTPVAVAAFALGLVFLVAAAVLARRQWTRRDKDWRVAVQHEAALEAAKLLKDWCAWLATLSTAAIAASGFLGPRAAGAGAGRNAFAVLAIVAFVAAILATATLLLALPSVVARFKRDKASVHNDFYEAQAFVWASTSLGRCTPLFRVGFIASLQYLCFALGVIAFSIHAALRLADA